MISFAEADKKLTCNQLEQKIRIATNGLKYETLSEAIIDMFCVQYVPMSDIAKTFKTSYYVIYRILDNLRKMGFDIPSAKSRGITGKPSKLTPQDKNEIKAMKKSGMTPLEIWETGKFNVTRQAILGVLWGSTKKKTLADQKQCLGYGYKGRSCGHYVDKDSIFCEYCKQRMKSKNTSIYATSEWVSV